MVKDRLNSTILGIVLSAAVGAACSVDDVSTDPVRASNALFAEQPGPFPREGECNLDDPRFDDIRHRIGSDHNIGPGTLKGVAIPEPSNLRDFVRNRARAIALGKAFFWDMQIGADGVQACASCHFRAGADPRSRNQSSPGGNDNPNKSFDHPVNGQLTRDMFPLHKLADPTDRRSAVLRSSDDVISSQGVFARDYVGAERGASEDDTIPTSDSVFNVGGVTTRRVQARNTPTVINAVFNFRQFWDGRAEPIFNGVNPFGARDPNAKVLKATGPNTLEWTVLRIDNASLASQAVGPVLSDTEMSANARSLHEVGRRVVSAKPLRNQKVHPQDSVLGPLRDRGGSGLDTTYAALIRETFEERWWQSDAIVVVDPVTKATTFAQLPGRPLKNNEYTLMEWNFGLFFGLAVQMYESTLVSDDAKIDRHFDRLAQGKPGLLSAAELEGMELFKKSACKDCHSGPEFNGASVRSIKTGFDNPAQNPTFQPPEQVERMVISTCEVAMYDQGFYNLGVRPTAEDLGVGGSDPFGNPLSVAKLLTMDPRSVPSQELLSIPYPSLMSLGRLPPIETGERTAVEGAFKMPSLRNVALTAPYFHNGGMLTLRQVVEFYNRGGDFHDANSRFIALGIGKLNLTETEIDKLVGFLHTLTDERVVKESAPFDHPEIFVPNGHDGTTSSVSQSGGEATTSLVRIPQVGAAGGGPSLKGFLE